MKLRLRDVISHQGRDYVIDGLLTYRLGPKVLPLARATDGPGVVWIEPLLDDLDDRILVLRQVADLAVIAPPPATIQYKGASYVPRLSGTATVEMTGNVPDRTPGPCDVWRYRAAGDLFLQIEKWPDRLIVLAGESVHKAMIDILPGT